ncbi:MAG: hypothetical protein PVJ67_05965 [Candidatus Pacearchaeota archaeon]|jgi:hypothetical protein
MAQKPGDKLLVEYTAEYFSVLGGHVEVGVKLFGDNYVSIQKRKNNKKTWIAKKKVLENFFDEKNLTLTSFPNGGYKIITEDLPIILGKSSFLNIPDFDETKSVREWERIKYRSGNNYIEKKWAHPLKLAWKCPEITLITEISNYLNDHWHNIL